MASKNQSTITSPIDEARTLQLAVEFHKKEQFKEAKDLYNAILHHNPKNADVMHRLGTIALQVERYEKAAEIIATAINTGAVTPTMYINYGAALRNLEKYDEAIEAYDQAITLDPDSNRCSLQ